MSFLNIAIPTATLWILDGLVVIPMAQELARRKLGLAVMPATAVPADKGAKQAMPGAYDGRTESEMRAYNAAPAKAAGPSDEVRRRFEDVFTLYYVLIDIIVLGTAGFVIGMLGCYLIGIALRAKGWPGMIALISASLAGYVLNGGVF